MKKSNESFKEEEIEDQNEDFKFKDEIDGVYDPNSTRKGLINEYKSRSGLTSGTESYEVVDVDFGSKNTAIEFTCNCGAKVNESDLSQHMKDMHGSKLGEARYKTYKTEHNLLITENDSNAKDTAVEGLYEQYIERYGESESWRLGGGFGDALRNDDLKDAWQRADLGNRDRLLELSGLTKEDLEVIAYGNESVRMDGYEMEDFYSSEDDEPDYQLLANPDGEFTVLDKDGNEVPDYEVPVEEAEDDVKVSLNVNDGTLSDVPIEESKAREVGTEICTCGHFGGSTSVEKNQHEDHFQIGHGACKECECQQFTWTPYYRYEEIRAGLQNGESNDDINSPDTTGFSQDKIGAGNYYTKTEYEDQPNKDIGSNSLTSKKGSSHSNGISETDKYYANMIGKLDGKSSEAGGGTGKFSWENDYFDLFGIDLKGLGWNKLVDIEYKIQELISQIETDLSDDGLGKWETDYNLYRSAVEDPLFNEDVKFAEKALDKLKNLHQKTEKIRDGTPWD